MSNIQIPPVTMDDLQAFHTKHFPWIEPTSGFTHAHDDSIIEEYVDEEEEDLGYYPDGVKRTLTDEQIKIFRHSEIHALLREKQLKEEELAEKAQEAAEDQAIQSQQKESVFNTVEEHVGKSKDQLGSMEPMTKTSSHATLDYDESAAQSAPRPRSAHPPQIAGRRIVSYDD
ncbi:hypothetical protein FE257_007865 [Aspergillus nanangensis]|uniref:Uncharacterized protein n=1 Tax=Aspergillus nanangensis TaxID=2582783 RepID=A0AAD4CZ24_ASPNN|nr:hypothetical protein FE257_007865 [Aspergillus nanangensis]